MLPLDYRQAQVKRRVFLKNLNRYERVHLEKYTEREKFQDLNVSAIRHLTSTEMDQQEGG